MTFVVENQALALLGYLLPVVVSFVGLVAVTRKFVVGYRSSRDEGKPSWLPVGAVLVLLLTIFALSAYLLVAKVRGARSYAINRSEIDSMEIDVYEHFFDEGGMGRYQFGRTLSVSRSDRIDESFSLLCDYSKPSHRNHDAYRKHYIVRFLGRDGVDLTTAIRVMPSSSSRTSIYLTEPGYLDPRIDKFANQGNRVVHVATMTNPEFGRWVESVEAKAKD